MRPRSGHTGRVRWLAIACSSLVALGACTSSGPDDSAPSTTSTTLRPSTTASVPVQVEPRPVEGDELLVGHSYDYELTDHCGFRSLPERLAGTYWVTTMSYDWRDLQRWLGGAVERGSFGVLGVLTRTADDELTFEVPGTDLRIAYGPSEEGIPCF